MSEPDLQELSRFAETLADASRALLRSAGSPVADMKADSSPVTATDRAVEVRLRDLITARFPDHGILGEEEAAVGADRKLCWVLDPIDGTLAYLAGFPVFGTLIALLEEGRPLLGVIDLPMTEERWVGRAGQPTLMNGSPVKVRSCPDLDQALIATSNLDYWSAMDLPRLDSLRDSARWCVYGGSCTAYARLASGQIDLAVDVAFDIHDYLALVPVIEGAGGRITDWQGGALTRHSGDRILAAGDTRLHARALQLLD